MIALGAAGVKSLWDFLLTLGNAVYSIHSMSVEWSDKLIPRTGEAPDIAALFCVLRIYHSPLYTENADGVSHLLNVSPSASIRSSALSPSLPLTKLTKSRFSAARRDVAA